MIIRTAVPCTIMSMIIISANDIVVFATVNLSVVNIMIMTTSTTAMVVLEPLRPKAEPGPSFGSLLPAVMGRRWAVTVFGMIAAACRYGTTWASWVEGELG